MAQPLTAANYYVQLQELTPKVGEAFAKEPKATSVALNAAWTVAPLVIFVFVLVIGLIFLIKSSSATLKRIMLLLVVAIGLGSLPIVTKGVLLPTQLEIRADVEHIPKNVQVTDVSANGFVVAWETTKPGIGAVRLLTDNEDLLNGRVLPETGLQVTSQHRVTVSDLKPDTLYRLEILSFNQWYDDGGKGIEVRTAL